MLSKDTDKKLFLLDAYALIYRAYYAFIRTPRINSKGMNTSAIFGFANVLLDILNNEKPSHLAVAFDLPGATFRSEEFPEYKANRDETPEDIRMSIPWIIKLIEAFNIPIISKEGFEADDVIGTVAKKAELEGFQTYMMTSDKDYGQLISENIFMYRPGRQGNKAEIWGVDEICDRFSIAHPLQVIDILGLMGDSVDNIPGIPGIGQKTATKLIRQYDSVEGLIENSHQLKGRQKENVEEFAQQGILSKHLATIVLDVPVKYSFDEFEISDLNRESMKELFDELEFRNLEKRVLGTTTEKASTGGEQMSMFDQVEEDIPAKAAEISNIENTKHDYKLVQSDSEIDELIEILKKSKSYCFDTETTGLDPILATIVGMSFSIQSHEAFYVPVPRDQNEAISFLERFLPIFEDESKEIIAQNLKYDFKVLLQYGIEIKNLVFDTMLAHYLINPDMRHNMDLLAETYLNYKPIPIETLIGKKGKNQGSLADKSPEEVLDYAAEDADITIQLKEAFSPMMKDAHLGKLFTELEIPLIRVLAKMELEGVNIDTEALRKFSEELGSDIATLEKEIHELADEEFNVDSPKQLGTILFEKMEISAKAKKTKTGQYSTSEDVLNKHKADHPIIEKILDYRQLRKLKSTYVDPLPELVNEKTNRVHTNYMQTVAATGRLSSNNPNLQNIPIRTAKGREIRKAFIPRDENHILLAADYSQVELRVIAALSEDDQMCKAFNDGLDIHSATASKVFHVDLEDVDRDMRSKAKAVNFGIIYGQGAFGLAQNLGIKRGEAKEIIESYFAQFSKLKDYQQDNIEFARKNGYVQTIMGRRRYLKDINSANAVVRSFAERNAINAPIQGSAADIIKIAMIDVFNDFEENNFKSKMVMQVHDELVFDVHKDEIEIVKPIIVDRMQNAVDLIVPLKVDLDSGNNWLEAH